MTPGLALFVKTPGLSPVKSRLWPAIGREAAEALYLGCAEVAGEAAIRLQRDGLVHACWALAEPESAVDAAAPHRWRSLPRLAQGEGGLGQRMARIYAELRARHGAALLIGTDLPQLSIHALAQAAQTLVDGAADLVLGPSADGGFWLVGGHVELPLSVWTAPRYSTADARADFRAALPAHLSVHMLATAHDLDAPDDLAVVAAALAALPQRTAAQEQVLHHLAALLGSVTR